MNGCRRVIQIWRACRTSGRFCSTACRSFFMRQTKTAQAHSKLMDWMPLLLVYYGPVRATLVRMY